MVHGFTEADITLYPKMHENPLYTLNLFLHQTEEDEDDDDAYFSRNHQVLLKRLVVKNTQLVFLSRRHTHTQSNN